MKDLVTRMRLRAEDVHLLNPSSETVKCLSLGADEIERLRLRVRELETECTPQHPVCPKQAKD